MASTNTKNKTVTTKLQKTYKFKSKLLFEKRLKHLMDTYSTWVTLEMSIVSTCSSLLKTVEPVFSRD